MASSVYGAKPETGLSILQRIAKKDKMAVEECFDKYGGLVWSITKKFTNSREDAEDAVQDIFIDIWKYAGRFDAAKSAESSFIVLLARRRLIDRLRKFNRQPKVFFLDEIANNQSDGWEKKLQMQIEIQQAVQELNKLNPQQRKVVCLAPVCYPNAMASSLLFSILDLNSKGVKYPKLECGRSVL